VINLSTWIANKRKMKKRLMFNREMPQNQIIMSKNKNWLRVMKMKIK